MYASLAKLAAVGTLFSLATAAPSSRRNVKRAFDCGAPVDGLAPEDCQHMSDIGVFGQGENSYSNNNNIWIGEDGGYKFHFTNHAGVPVNIIMWDKNAGDASSFVAARAPQISYTLANQDDQVTISLGDLVGGGFSILYNRETTLSPNGQVFNTWGEFNTDPEHSTIDVSREPNMQGNGLNIKTQEGCTTNMDTCVFVCKDPNAQSCWESGSYDLQNCDAATNPHAAPGMFGDNPVGGCEGWNNGSVEIEILN